MQNESLLCTMLSLTKLTEYAYYVKGFVCFAAQRETGCKVQAVSWLHVDCRRSTTECAETERVPHSLALGTPQPHHCPHFRSRRSPGQPSSPRFSSLAR
jgi:hypothetical protein